MRVTKKVEDYIRAQVRAKVFPKYEAEEAESQRIIQLRNNIESRASQAAIEAAKAIFVAEAKAYEDILEYNEDAIKRAYLSCYRPIDIKNFSYIDSVHKWETRFNEEVDKIVDEIVIALELGGNKADLDRMLSEIE